MKTELIELKHIVADPNQPRKIFDAFKLKSLKDSVAKHGVMNPLIVEKMSNGKYQILDGERRFRVATDLKMKSVPTVIIAPKSEIERLLQQFHIQQQHEAWSSVEKANALGKISEELGVPILELCKEAGISEKMARNFMAFYQLSQKELFQKSDISFEFANPLITLGKSIQRAYLDKEEVFNDTDIRALEKSIINKVKAGVIKKPAELVTLRDSIKVNPKAIEDFIKNDKMTSNELFSKSKARGALHLRRLSAVAWVASNHLKAVLESKTKITLSSTEKNNLRNLIVSLTKFLESSE